MLPSYALLYVPQCKIFEGDVPWMYLDTIGNVTVGVGKMLPSPEAACALPFYLQDGSTKATDEQIVDCYLRVKFMDAGKLPEFYAYAGSLVMQQADVDGMLLGILADLDLKLAAHFSGFESWPDNAKMALLDQAFNLGFAGFVAGYPLECAAVERGDWVEAAEQSGRRGISAERNEWTKNMFISCATAS